MCAESGCDKKKGAVGTPVKEPVQKNGKAPTKAHKYVFGAYISSKISQLHKQKARLLVTPLSSPLSLLLQ